MSEFAAALDAVTADELRRRPGMKWSRFAPEVLPAFVAEMDFGTAPAVQSAIVDAVERYGYGYLPVPLAAELGETVARWYADEYGWSLDPELIRPLPDVLGALAVVVERFSSPGSPVIVPTPAYMPFLVEPARLGRELVQLPMLDDRGRYTMDLEALDAALAAGAETLVLCNPHNPTGTVATTAELQAIAEVVDRHAAMVFSDEIHAPIRFGSARHVPYASLSDVAARHTVTAISASKAWNLPGLKCASMIFSNPDHLAAWKPIGFHSELGASTLGVVANIAAFRAAKPWLDEVLHYLDGSRGVLAELISEHLPGARYRQPDGTYLAWIDLRESDAEGEIEADDGPAPLHRLFFERARVALTDGNDCGAPGLVRINFATPRPILRELIERMGAALTSR